jgi:hypothetical protein
MLRRIVGFLALPKDRLPSVRVARPFVQDKNAGEVSDIPDSSQEFWRQVIQYHAGRSYVKRSQLLAASARNRLAGKLDSQCFCVFNQPVGYFNDFDTRHWQSQRQAQSRRQHFVGKHSYMLGIVLELGDVPISVGRA